MEYWDSDWEIRDGGGTKESCVSSRCRSRSASPAAVGGRDGRDASSSGRRGEPSAVSRSFPLGGKNESETFPGVIGEPGSVGSGGATPMPEWYPLEDDDDDVMVAPAVEGRGGSFDDGLPDERLSRLTLLDGDNSGADFLCAEGDSGGSVCDPEAKGGRGMAGEDGTPGEEESEIAASEPRRPSRGREGDAGGGAVSWRVLFRRNHVLDFFSGVRSLSFAGAVPFGKV